MIIEELMVGDWVKPKYRRTGVIDGVEPFQINYINALDDKEVYISGGIHDWEDLNDIEPIPITLKILKRNGFKFYREETTLHFTWGEETTSFIHIAIDEDGYRSIYVEGNGNSVDLTLKGNIHELQHALRLCGINKEIEL